MTTASRILLFGCLAFALRLYAQSPGRLAGRVLAEESGKPLAGATVLAVQRIAPAPPVILRGVTDSDGVYAIDGALAGTFGLCIRAGTVYLDPCEWEAPIAGLAGGPPQEIRVRLGIPVVVRVDDAAGHAANRDPRKPGSVLAVTLASVTGRDRPLPLTSQGGGVYEYSYLAPGETPLRVKVSSDEFLLADALGSPINERGHMFSIVTPPAASRVPERMKIRLPFTTPRFGPPPVFVPVRIRGKK